jgi:hypothetical protein
MVDNILHDGVEKGGGEGGVKPTFIVAEVTQTFVRGEPSWLEGMPYGLGSRLELVIKTNLERGYEPVTMSSHAATDGEVYTETAIVVFRTRTLRWTYSGPECRVDES